LCQNIPIGIIISRAFINKINRKARMTQPKPLVVIVDQEARRNLVSLDFKWFPSSREIRNGHYLIETPIGERVEVEGTLVEDPNLDVHAAEFLYLEVTPACQLNCAHCGVKGDALKTKGEVTLNTVPYLTEEFALALGENMKNYPYSKMQRSFFFGGGEPLIAPEKFSRLQEILQNLPQTYRIVTTNGLSLPLEEEKFAAFMEYIHKPQLMLSLSQAHRQQYEILARKGGFPGYIPNVPPEQALFEKAAILHRHCVKLGLPYAINAVERSPHALATELRELILHSATLEPNIVCTTIDGSRNPCSQGEEMAIRSNGRIYPHCYHIFNGKYYIGRMGLLID